MQRAYLAAYLAYGDGRTADALRIAQPHMQYPVAHWRRRFEDILQHIQEPSQQVGPAAAEERYAGDAEETHARQRALERQAQKAPALDFTMQGSSVRVEHENVSECTVSCFEVPL